MKTHLQLARFLAVALALSLPSLAPGETRRPNVLVILADDLGYGETGIQGNPQIPTPHIDSIGKNGVRFTSGYVSGTYCSPTRAGLFTGRYQQRFGHEFNPGPAQTAGQAVGLPVEEKTIGDRFKAAGYTTGWFGKSHLGYEPQFHPLKRGFDEFYGFLGGAHDYFNAQIDRQNLILKGTDAVESIEYTTESFAQEASSFIDRHKDKPWFVYLPFNAVHGPLQAPEKYLSRFAGIQDEKRRTFAAQLLALDDAIGSVLEKLRATGQEENTLIFFLSDNGGPTRQITSGNGPLRGFKGQTWEGGVRVAWLVQWKGRIPAGQVDARPVIQLDILPTALAAAGVEASPDWKLDGVNLLPYVTGEKKEAPHEALYWRFGGQLAIRKGAWKLVKAPLQEQGAQTRDAVASVDGAQLFNLDEDIGETKDLAASQPEKVKELAAAWEKWNAELVAPKWLPRQVGKKQGQEAGGGRKKQAASATPAASSL